MGTEKTQNNNSITEEIVDGLAKKYTELEKRYAELEKSQAKTEGLDETVNGLIPKVKTLEVNAASYPKVYVLDYSKDFKELFAQLQQLKQAYDQAIRQLEGKIKAMPKTLPVKNYHHFEPKAKPVLYLFIAMILAVTVLSGLCIGLGIENVRRSDESNKFMILRGFYPDIAKAIDDAYANDDGKLMKKAEANIHEQQAMSEAAFAAKQAAEEKAASEGKNKRQGNRSARHKTH